MLRTYLFKAFVLVWDGLGMLLLVPFLIFIGVSHLITYVFNYDKN